VPCHHLHAFAAATPVVFLLCRHECHQLSDFDYVVVNREGQLEECVNKLCTYIPRLPLLLLCLCAGMNVASCPTLTMS
jgi:hypothetical protein